MQLLTIPLSQNESKELTEITQHISSQAPRDLDTIVKLARNIVPGVRERVPDVVSQLGLLLDPRRTPKAIVISDFPQEKDQKCLSILAAFLLSEPIKYEDEGEYVVEVKSRSKQDMERPSFQNAREFTSHTDLSYISEPPPFFLLHSLFNDATEGGFSVLCDLQEVISRLSQEMLFELTQPQFFFPAPSHYRGKAIVVHPILTRTANGDYAVRFRRDGLRAKTRAGMEAVLEFVQLCAQSSFEMSLEGNSVLYVDNMRCTHGRTSFLSGNAQKEPRHLNRVYAMGGEV